MYIFKHNDNIIEYNNGFLINNFYTTNLFYIIINNKTIKIAYSTYDNDIKFTKSGNKYLYYKNNKFFPIYFEPYMIVYEKSDKRIQNYNHVNKLFNNIINKIGAVDTITDNNTFDEMVFKYLNNNTITNNYIKDVILKSQNNNYVYKGKLGVLLSHTNIFKQIISQKQDKRWFLIIEDDIQINLDINENVIQKINEYIKLFIHPDNIKNQFEKKNKIHNNIYKLNNNQWSNIIYLIHYDGIKYILDNLFPVDTFFDKSISTFYNILNGVYIKNTIFETCGSINACDNTSKLGSIIFNIS